MPGVLAIAFGLFILFVVLQARKAGPRQLSDARLARGRPLVRIEAGTEGTGWDGLGSKTTTRGIHVRFDHDDDPQAEATLFVPGRTPEERTTSVANRLTVDLESAFTDYHVHTGGYVFRIRMRGTGDIIGRQTRIQMVVDGSGEPIGGRMENDDDTRAAVGDWIEVEYAEVLEIPDVRV